MSRQIFIDTETTGLEVAAGHRIVELACVLSEDRKISMTHRQWYLNPERLMEREVINIHGIENEFLQDKDLFATIANEFVEFVAGAELIMHNADFDTAFINMELARAGLQQLSDYCAAITDSLAIARKMHPGQGNSLKALCRRYNIDDSERVKHGALLDAELLAQVYFAMTSGQSSMALAAPSKKRRRKLAKEQIDPVVAAGNLIRMQVTTAEQKEHLNFLERIRNSSGKCLFDN